MTLAVLDGHFGLNLPSPEPRQLSSRRLDRLLGRFRQFFHHGPILEVKVPHAFLNVFPVTRNGYSLVDHFLPAAYASVARNPCRLLLRSLMGRRNEPTGT